MNAFALIEATDVDAVLRGAFAPLALVVSDDSHLHAGHAGAREGRHFSVRIVSDRFTGLARVARHRLVYDALGSYMKSGIHALALVALTPAEDSPSAAPCAKPLRP